MNYPFQNILTAAGLCTDVNIWEWEQAAKQTPGRLLNALRCFFNVGAAPAGGCYLLTCKQRARASGIFGFAGVQLAVAAVLLVGLGYVANTTKVDAKKYPKHAKEQNCGNCQLYAGKAKDAAGPCPLFAGKQVAAAGWCSAYVKKAA